MKPTFVILPLLAFLPASCSPAPDALPSVTGAFSTNFGTGDAGGWQSQSLAPAKPSFAFPSAGEKPGLKFTSQGLDLLTREWPVGTAPFELSADIKLTGGNAEPYRNKGLVISLSTAPVDKMGDKDWGVMFAPLSQGIIATVRHGGMRYASQIRPGVWAFAGGDLAARFQLTQSGAGGQDFSISWPAAALADTHLRLHAWRDGQNNITLTAYNDQGVDGPWWQGKMTLPAQYREVPLRYLTLQNGRDPIDFANPEKAPSGGVPVTGVLEKLEGGPLEPGGAPRLNQPFPSATLAPPPGWTPHSRLLSEQDMVALRAKFNSPAFAAYKTMVLRQASPTAVAAASYGTAGQNEPLFALTFAYVLTQDKAAYWQALLGQIDGLSSVTDLLPAEKWGMPGHMQQNLNVREFFVHNLAVLALTYDLVGSELDAKRRDRLRYMLEHALKEYNRLLDVNDWWFANNPSNTIGVGNGAMGIVAVAMMDEDKQLAQRSIERGLEKIRSKYVGVDNDGGSIEGNMYWQYGLSYQMLLGWALRQTTGNDQGLLTSAQVRHATNYVKVNLGGDGKMIPFNDTEPWITGWSVLAAAGAAANDPTARWMADYAAGSYTTAKDVAELNRSSYSIPAFLYRDLVPAPADFPGLPNVATLDSVQQGVLRSDGTKFVPELVTGIKGNGRNNTHHAESDQGSYVLYADGQMILIDPGYYEGDAQKHSLPLLGDASKMQLDTRAFCPISEVWQAGDIRGMSLDATAAYNEGPNKAKPLAQRVKRVFVQVGAQSLVVLDDAVPRGPDMTVTAQYQCGVPVKVTGAGAVLQGPKGDVTMQCFGPEVGLVSTPRKFATEWIFKQMGVPWSTLSAVYHASGSRPLVTVYSRVVKGAAAPKAVVDYGTDTLKVTTPGQSIEFRLTDKGWSAVHS